MCAEVRKVGFYLAGTIGRISGPIRKAGEIERFTNKVAVQCTLRSSQAWTGNKISPKYSGIFACLRLEGVEGTKSMRQWNNPSASGIHTIHSLPTLAVTIVKAGRCIIVIVIYVSGQREQYLKKYLKRDCLTQQEDHFSVKHFFKYYFDIERFPIWSDHKYP